MMFAPRSWYEQYNRPAEDKLREAMDAEPHYPFKMLGPNGMDAGGGIDRDLVLRVEDDANHFYKMVVRYKIVYLGMVGFAISATLIVAWAASNSVQKNDWFLFPIFGVVVSLATAYNYRSLRVYVLDLGEEEYRFSHDDVLYTRGRLHNIYVRLKREARGNTGDARQKRYYHLVLNGYQIDQVVISGSSSNVAEIRRLGQLIANNLNLNYFDEHNSSDHHVIRHFRPPKYQMAQEADDSHQHQFDMK